MAFPDDLSEQAVPGRVQALARLRFVAFSLLFTGAAVAFWSGFVLLRTRRGTAPDGPWLVLCTLGLAAFAVGMALAVVAQVRSRRIAQEVTAGEKTTDTRAWSDPGLRVVKGVVDLAVSGPCVLCRAPASTRRVLRAQLRQAHGGGLAGHAVAAGRYAYEKKKYGWPKGVQMVQVAVPLCEDCRARFPRWTLVLLGLGVLLAAGSFLFHLDGAQRLLALFLPPSVGGAVALAGLVAAEQPVPVRIRKWRERIEVELPPGTRLTVPAPPGVTEAGDKLG